MTIMIRMKILAATFIELPCHYKYHDNYVFDTVLGLDRSNRRIFLVTDDIGRQSEEKKDHVNSKRIERGILHYRE